MCLEKQDKFDAALVHLRNNEVRLVDGLAFRVKQAELLVMSRRFNEARIRYIYVYIYIQVYMYVYIYMYTNIYIYIYIYGIIGDV
jgi:hypothetical protein